MGYQLTLRPELSQVAYNACGPFENYPDRKAGSFPAVYKSTVADMVEYYARPNDMGNREGARWVSLSETNANAGLTVSALNDSVFAFSAIPYTPSELCFTKHWAEFPTPTKTVLTLLAVNRGLGNASCGPGPLARDIPRADKPYHLNLAFRPATLQPLPVYEAKVALDETIPPPPDTFTVVECTSQEPGNEGSKVCDGDLSTMWHSQYGVTLGKYPHSVTMDLQKVRTLKGITCYGRQEGANGRIKDFRVEVSRDGKTWTQVAQGALQNTSAPQKVLFASPAKDVRYLRFTGLSEQHGQEYASMAEIMIIE